ncbi:MAG TPA: hypothetical protein VF526_15005 [Solirubrobacteraceae bacterium]|jgi:hypothetical protein
MQTSDLVLVRGLDDTRTTLDAWNGRPWPVLARWFGASLAIAALLLLAVWVVATQSVPDQGFVTFPGMDGEPQIDQVWHVLGRNSLVLALHGFACVAGFIAGSSLPLQAQQRSGLWRWVHDKAGPLAIAFVIGATSFSLITQTLVLGQGAATLAAHLHISPALLLVGLLPHAVPELVALFLPLAAWMIASRQGDWHVLLAATVVTVTLAVPILSASAFVEVFVSPGLLHALAG